MNLSQHTALWKKIQAFSLDEPGAAITFSSKLSSQQKWSPAYTQRVIDEYRRFIFLCAISPKGASPSKAVDEAWHLHLTYTHSYWIKLCREILGKDIHHIPSNGGDAENHKHDDWYKETLTFYKNVFGTSPPADIWPVPVQKPSFTFTEPVAGIKNEIVVMAIAIMLLPFLAIEWLYDQPNPFLVTGPHFLVFYFLLITVTLISFVVLQGYRSKRFADSTFPGNINPFEAAQFFDGKHRAIQTAIIDLVRRKLLEVSNDHFIVRRSNYIPAAQEKNPFVTALLKEDEGVVVNYEMIASNWYKAHLFMHPALKNMLQSPGKKQPFLQKYAVVLPVFLIGVARVMQGAYNARPVSYLVVAIIVLVLLARFIGKRLSARNTILRRSRKLYNERVSSQPMYQDDIVPAFALSGNPVMGGFAEGAVLGSMFIMAAPPLSPKERSGWNSDSYNASDTSSYSSSNCSGGGSCGSGGCGGCGGGD
jgi:uncharacterized protein (TIGR04222 family)